MHRGLTFAGKIVLLGFILTTSIAFHLLDPTSYVATIYSILSVVFLILFFKLDD